MPFDDAHRTWSGRLTDGRTARSATVDVAFGADGLVVTPPGGPALHWTFADLTIATPIQTRTSDVLVMSQTSRGATLFIDSSDFAARLAGRVPRLRMASERWRTLKPGLAVSAVVFGAAALIYGFDLSPSKWVATLMPARTRVSLGETALASLPTNRRCTGAEGIAALDKLARRLLPEAPDLVARITVVDWGVVNAFAVPGGRVVLTRGIIERATSADEIAGVLAHEMGHGVELHPEAGLVRAIGLSVLSQMVFTGSPGVLGNAGEIIAQFSYSRASEREADTRALEFLKVAGISPKPFAEFFRRLEGGRTRQPPSGGRAIVDIFSTHPASPERIAKIEAQPAYPTTPALDPAEWQALKEVCKTITGGGPALPGGPTAPR